MIGLGWDETRAEMVNVAGDIDARWTKRLLNTMHETMQSSDDWRIGLIVPIWRGKEMRKTLGNTEASLC